MDELPKDGSFLSYYDLKLYYNAILPPWGAKAIPAVSGHGTLPVCLTFRQTTRMLLGAHVLC
jgi:hypothetical protein